MGENEAHRLIGTRFQVDYDMCCRINYDYHHFSGGVVLKDRQGIAVVSCTHHPNGNGGIQLKIS